MRKALSFLLAAVMVFSLAACSGGTGNGNGANSTTTPSEGWSKEFTILIGYGDDWMPFPGKSGVAFANSNKNVLEISDNGTKVEFTGLVEGNSVITATLDGQESKALVHVRPLEGKKYITYNKPVEAYYIEFSSGRVDAYENKECMGISIGGDAAYYSPDGKFYNRDNSDPGHWYPYTDDPEKPLEYVADSYKRFVYPLGQFAAFASGMQTSELANVAESPIYELPDKLDVTQYYVKSENVIGIMCDVFTHQDATWWVDPTTGFTLKMTSSGLSFEVTKLVIGSPDWDGLHLRPQKGDIRDDGEITYF